LAVVSGVRMLVKAQQQYMYVISHSQDVQLSMMLETDCFYILL